MKLKCGRDTTPKRNSSSRVSPLLGRVSVRVADNPPKTHGDASQNAVFRELEADMPALTLSIQNPFERE